MALFELRRIDQEGVFYDQYAGFVLVCAADEAAARALAATDSAHGGATFWVDDELSSCTELDPDGDPAVIFRDFHAAVET